VIRALAAPESAAPPWARPGASPPPRVVHTPTNPALAERARGTLIGLSFGDALGAPVEFLLEP
jgi:hypothetical protein